MASEKTTSYPADLIDDFNAQMIDASYWRASITFKNDMDEYVVYLPPEWLVYMRRKCFTPEELAGVVKPEDYPRNDEIRQRLCERDPQNQYHWKYVNDLDEIWRLYERYLIVTMRENKRDKVPEIIPPTQALFTRRYPIHEDIYPMTKLVEKQTTITELYKKFVKESDAMLEE